MIKRPQKFILDIVPLIKIPLTREPYFCYLSDKKLPSGTLVEIPLFRKKTAGIVSSSRKDFKRLGNIELKKIDKVLENDFLDKNQMLLANFISEYYISPLGIVLKNFVPKRVKSRKYNVLSIKQEKKKNITLTSEQKNVVEKIVKGNSKFLLFGPSGSGKTEIYIHSILELRKKDKNIQFLILVPEKTLTPQAFERYGQYFDLKEIVLLSSNISKGQYYSNWQKIRSGEAKIVIGTRMAVFAPFKKLGLIVIDEEQDMSYKQWDMNPRYDARTVAEKIAEIHKCPLVRGSATPSPESYQRASNREYKLLELPPLQLPDAKRKISETVIVDIKKERWAKNYSPISKKLESEIAYALKNKLQVVLFINRQGMSNFTVCAKCKTLLKCPKCDRALVYGSDGNYKCLHCSYKSGIFPKCQKCNSIEFKNVGLGTQKVEREISKIFSSAKILVADTAHIRKTGFQEKLYRDFSQGKADILIGTQMISKGWDLPRVALVGIIDMDNMLTIPDFNAEEKVFEAIVQVIGRTNRPGAKFPGTAIIQTFQPENKVIQWAAERNYENFWKYELEERKSLNLPPFSRIIKLVFQDYSRKKIEDQTEIAYEMLEKIKKAKISEPYDPLVPKIRGRYRKQIIIKYKKDIMPEEIRKILKGLSPGWIIDVDPVSIA